MKNNNYDIPLYERMRPTTLDEFVGQQHIINQNSYLNRAIKSDRLGSCIFYGTPGCGKTTLANIIANNSNANFIKLNAVSSGVSDAKKAIEKGKYDLEVYGKKTYLLLDECHRWSKSQSDCVLEAIEKGYIIFIGSTTENPHINMTPAIVSRCRLFKFLSLQTNDIKDFLLRALENEEKGLGKEKINIDSDALNLIATMCNGDLRNALNALEIAALTTEKDINETINITKKVAEDCLQSKSVSVDNSLYYDLLSAFCKSMRGSDSDSALYYAQRLLVAGCDPLLIVRRMIVHASEDIGMADTNAALIASHALTSLKNIGMPESNVILCHAIVYICEAEKSNSVYNAMHQARFDAEKNADDKVPAHLKNHKYEEEEKGNYKYPHDFGGYVKQQYLPDTLKDKVYYTPSKNGREKNLVRKKIF